MLQEMRMYLDRFLMIHGPRLYDLWIIQIKQPGKTVNPGSAGDRLGMDWPRLVRELREATLQPTW
ncbi:hypothetical protein AWV80_13390 [Cupriavidus sp. UYMU48A]|nr:hypothetical protein AWV80_13390 [Cupriavidus sp. UYMU48A]